MTRYLQLMFLCTAIVTFQNVDSTLIVANGTSIVEIDTSTNHQTILYDNLQRAVAVAVDVADGLLFWTDVETGSIYRGSIDGQQAPQEIIKDLDRPNGLAVDWISNNIYWTDGIMGTIEVAKNDGRFRRTLLYGLSNPRGIAVNPAVGYMYWTDQDSDTVESAKLDGSNAQSLVNTGLDWPNEIVVDSQNKLYWIDGKHHTIESLQYGSVDPPVQVVNLSSISNDVMFGLALEGQTLYFSVWTEGAVYSVSTSGTNVARVASGFGDYVFGLAVADVSVQPGSSNACSSQPSYCSQLCLPTSATTRTCACSSYDELTLMSDGRTCGLADEFLLYCAGHDGQIRLLALDGHASGRSIVVNQATRCVALDYDPVDQVIYYSDVAMLEIRRVGLSGNDSQRFLYEGVGIVDGMAIDVLHGRLYFTNWNILYATNTGDEWARIEMVDLDGTNRKRIIESGLQRPRAIQLDVQAGYLYYSDWGLNPGIVRTDLDGQNPTTILSQNVENPNGIVLSDSKLYFIDSHYSSGSAPTLEYSNLDGTNRNAITFPLPLQLPYGLEVVGNTVYWSDWNTTAIYMADLTTGAVSMLVDDILEPMAVKYGTRTASPNMGPDRCLNSGCTGMCVHAPAANTRCLCPDKGGKVLSDDGLQCIAPTSFLLVADVYDVRMVGFDTSDRQAYPVVTTTQDDNIVAIAFDSATNFVYWSSVHYGTIRRMNFFMADSTPEDFFRNAEIIDGMTIDSNTLYWTDYGLKTVEKMSLDDTDGSTHEILLTNISSPRAVIVNSGYLYFTDWTPGDVSVQRLNLNTRVLTTIIQGNIKKPNGLAISNNKLYVIDGEELIILKSDLDGTNQETLSYLSSSFSHAYDLEVVGDSLVFSDWHDKVVYLAKFNSGRLEKIVRNLNRPTEVVIQGDIPVNDCSSSPCKNGGICTDGENTYTCQCAPGWTGMNCDSDIDECASVPCKNGGSCNNGQNSYTCTCPQGWTGINCDTGTTVSTPAPGPVSFRLCPTAPIQLTVSEDSDTAYLDVNIEAIDARGNVIAHEVLGTIQIPSTLQFNEQTKAGVHINVRAAVGQQEAWCRFQVKLVDPYPPKITFCPPDQSQTTSDAAVEIDWDPPVATDNTELASVTTSRESGSDFTVIGSPHTVTVRATDTSANVATCTFEITIIHIRAECADLQVPGNGALSCGESPDGFQCILHCKEGYMPFRNRHIYNCIDEQWQPTESPRCSRNAPGQHVEQTVVFVYQSACGIAMYKDEIINKLQENLEDHDLCHKRNHPRVCDRNSFVIKCGTGSRKRQATDDLTVQFNVQIVNEAGGTSGDDESQEILENMTVSMNESVAGIEQLMKQGSLDLEIDGQSITTDPDYFSVGEPKWTCFDGHLSTADGCVPCPVGTMYDALLDECSFCPVGMYQEDEAQLQCLECKDGKYTETTGSFRESQCLMKKGEDFPLVIVIVCVAVGLVLLIVIVVIVAVCLRQKGNAKKRNARQRNGQPNEGYDGGSGHLRRHHTQKLRQAMYSDQDQNNDVDNSPGINNAELEEDSNYTPLTEKPKSDYMALDKTREGFKRNDLSPEALNTFSTSGNTADDKV